MSFKKNLLRFASLAALCAAPAMSGPYFLSNWSNIWKTTIDFDAQSLAAGHPYFPTWDPPLGGGAGTKYLTISLGNNTNGAAGQCYSIIIESIAPANPDLRFWTSDNRSLDDDGPGHARPYAKLWITGLYTLTISAYSTNYNSNAFTIYNAITGATSAASCNDGVSPFYNQVDNTILRANTTAN